MKYTVSIIQPRSSTDVYEIVLPPGNYNMLRRMLSEIMLTQIDFIDSPISIIIEEAP